MEIRDLIGTWLLVSWKAVSEKGHVFFPFGTNPKGMLIYTPEGHMSVSMMKDKSSLRKSKFSKLFNTDFLHPEDDFMSYCGRFELKDNKIIHHIFIGQPKSWIGTHQERDFTFEKGLLTLSAVKNGATHILTWRCTS